MYSDGGGIAVPTAAIPGRGSNRNRRCRCRSGDADRRRRKTEGPNHKLVDRSVSGTDTTHAETAIVFRQQTSKREPTAYVPATEDAEHQ